MKLRQVIQNLSWAGEITNTTVVEWIDEHRQGAARNATPDDLELIGDAISSGYLAQIAALNAAHAAAIAQLQADHAATIAAATADPASTLLADLDAAFETLVLEPYRAAFASAWATVRVLLQAGKIGLAADFVRALDVPDEMILARTQIADMIEALP